MLLLIYPLAYYLRDSFKGLDFFDNWIWETFDDPTHGRVNYVDMPIAQASNLSYASDDTFVMRVDANNTVPSTARGRDSVRIISKSSYGDSLLVLQLKHMPEGCATWPAFWTLSAAGPWPNGGEIDIIEGVNLNTQNLASLHTSSDCAMPSSPQQCGTQVSSDCDAAKNFNQGCGTSFKSPYSYGTGFNTQGGGWFVMERSKNKGIRIWFWSRNDPNVPPEIKEPFDTIEPNSSWGDPEAHFPVETCDYNSHFNDHRLIFDTTLCGDWAGTAFQNAGCGSGSCQDYVDNNPERFEDAYWEVEGLHVLV
ncbi:hypothetical protein L208DRAFT_1454463 [Tricholoma matsutake]|nr:hypothetical protein L208DRAFT_1454463 [Tricholoma matsutake 945]